MEQQDEEKIRYQKQIVDHESLNRDGEDFARRSRSPCELEDRLSGLELNLFINKCLAVLDGLRPCSTLREGEKGTGEERCVMSPVLDLRVGVENSVTETEETAETEEGVEVQLKPALVNGEGAFRMGEDMEYGDDKEKREGDEGALAGDAKEDKVCGALSGDRCMDCARVFCCALPLLEKLFCVPFKW